MTQHHAGTAGWGRGFRTNLATLCATVMLTAGAAQCLIIYRFGGEDLEPPPEADQPGVEFIQNSWEEVDPGAGGETFDLDLSREAVRALRRDPQVNIAPTAVERGGRFVRPEVNAEVWDSDTSTVWAASRYLCAEIAEGNYFLTCTDDFGTEGTANIDLGGLFQIHRIRLISGLRDPGRTVQAVRVFMAMEMPPIRHVTIHPRPWSPWMFEVRDNRQQVLDILLPPHDDVGFVQVTLGEHDTEWDVHDIEIFAKGFAPRSTYTSNIIDFGRDMAWGELRWSGSRGERAKVSIQSRSGADDTPVVYLKYTGRGEQTVPVTLAQYSGLVPGEKAGSTHDRENWSFWYSYDFADSLGTQVVCPSSRQYLQFLVDFLPLESDGGEVSFLEFRASEPVAEQLVGEVWPSVVRVGEWTEFTYSLRPTIGSTDAGFDRVEIQSLSVLGEIQEIRIGDEPVIHTVEAAEPNRLAVAIPPLNSADNRTLVAVDFTAQVLRYGAGFEARVWNSEQPLEVPQAADPGDATGEFEGNGTTVATSDAGQGDLLHVRVDQAVLTPNGDGTNDQVRLAYDILEITGAAAVRVEVSDLSGRLVRLLHAESQGVGTYEQLWDGLDDNANLVPPGVYLATVSADSDREKIRRMQVLHVVY